MSKEKKQKSITNHEDGAMQSYVTGFILSLIFTLIPYYMVINQTFKGTTLLITILGFAVIQMFIQVTFFLHLGRGPKPRWNLYFYAGTIGVVIMVVGGSVLIINNLHYNMGTSDQIKRLVNDEGIYQVGGQSTGACQSTNTNYQVVFTDSAVGPRTATTKICDTLTFVNDGEELLEVTFGEHDQHVPYAGNKRLLIKSGHSKTITLSDTGSYKFHDHLRDELNGVFTVTK